VVGTHSAAEFNDTSFKRTERPSTRSVFSSNSSGQMVSCVVVFGFVHSNGASVGIERGGSLVQCDCLSFLPQLVQLESPKLS
jgi:hypothetical protein